MIFTKLFLFEQCNISYPCLVDGIEFRLVLNVTGLGSNDPKHLNASECSPDTCIGAPSTMRTHVRL